MGGAQAVDSALNSIATARLDILKEPVAPAFGVATSRTVSARDLDNMNKASSCKPAVSIKALYSLDQSTLHYLHLSSFIQIELCISPSLLVCMLPSGASWL